MMICKFAFVLTVALFSTYSYAYAQSSDIKEIENDSGISTGLALSSEFVEFLNEVGVEFDRYFTIEFAVLSLEDDSPAWPLPQADYAHIRQSKTVEELIAKLSSEFSTVVFRADAEDPKLIRVIDVRVADMGEAAPLDQRVSYEHKGMAAKLLRKIGEDLDAVLVDNNAQRTGAENMIGGLVWIDIDVDNVPVRTILDLMQPRTKKARLLWVTRYYVNPDKVEAAIVLTPIVPDAEVDDEKK